MTRSSKSIYGKADSFSRNAKDLGFRSRSSLKLLEIQNKDRFIKTSSKVLDLGSSPGGWSQVAAEILNKDGLILSVDKKSMKPIRGVYFLKKDIKNLEKNDFLINKKNINNFDIVLSDIAPNISGIPEVDAANMVRLLDTIKIIIKSYLIVKGSALIKVFHGESFDNMIIFMKSEFQKVKIRKPKSSRPNSSETYILGLGKK
ncbi:MAG: 23S rRNA methyltransferase [Gammaproteobacteria bacterium]|nr:23S rRNA methyltransferase [Gammaproteobacteria bacterium]